MQIGLGGPVLSAQSQGENSVELPIKPRRNVHHSTHIHGWEQGSLDIVFSPWQQEEQVNRDLGE